MKISELITLLETTKTQRGDIDVLFHTPDENEPGSTSPYERLRAVP